MPAIEFNQIQIDALREISSIAAGNAATSLAVLLDRKINISVPEITIEGIERIPDALGGDHHVANVIYFGVSGQIPGSLLFILPDAESLRLANILTGNESSPAGELDEMGLSALKELGNITTGAYLCALAQSLNLNMKISYSVPSFSSDVRGSIVDCILARLPLNAGYALIMKNAFAVKKVAYKINFVFIPEPEGLTFMLKALEGAVP